MKTLLPVVAGLLAIGALTYLCANHHRPHIEADLINRTQAALVASPKAVVSAEGQIITLRGEVASEDLKGMAGGEAAKVFGVEEVRNLLTVVTVPQAKIPASKGGPAERMASAGYGPNNPIAGGATPGGRQKNRGTEFKVKGI